jgi:phenylacetate-CoA ligase
MAITNLVAYPGAYTTAIVMAYLNEAGCIRVNLDRTAWRNESDCRRYLEAWQSPVWLGDPIALGELEKVDIGYAPQAIISSIMHLHRGYSEELKSRYGCPVLDVYAMTEAGIIAVSDGDGHRIIPHDLYVEILDTAGRRCPSGVRGEITLSGGRNPFLPLLRYRTGDYASLEVRGGERVLCDLVGREPESYLAESGRTVHSMEIVRLMREFPVRRYALRSTAEGYLLEYRGDLDRNALESRLRKLMGNRFQGFILE